MGKYKISKAQVKRLIEGNPVVDGHGRKFYANGDVKNLLVAIDTRNLYHKYDLIVENGTLDIVTKKKVGA